MTQATNVKNLSLYHFQACPFCARTRQVIDLLGLDIPKKDTRLKPAYRTELVQQGGRSQVPCLKIETLDGQTEWLYESSDIIKYLRANADILSELNTQTA